MKKTLAITLAVVLIVSLLAGCSNTTKNEENPSESQGTTPTTNGSEGSVSTGTGRITEDGRTKVIVGTTNNTGSFDPLVSAQSSNRKDMDFLVFECLYAQTEQYEFVPVLAKERVDIDAVTTQITIYDYIYDSAGNQITAADVVWCYENEAKSGVITTLESIKEIDTFTVEIKVNKSVVGILDAALTSVTIVSQKAYEESSDNMAADPVGTGPYVLKQFNNGTGSIWEANENYWQTDESLRGPYAKQNVDVIEFQIIGDKAQVATALQAGAIDISDCLLASDAPAFEAGGAHSEGMVVSPVAKNLLLMFNFNVSEDSPFNNVNLRKAVASCFDVEQLIVGAESGYGIRAYHAYSDYFCLYDANDTDSAYSYDIDAAKEYLKKFEEETGTSASSLSLKILANSNNSAPCELLGAFLTQLGVGYELLMLDQSVVNTTLTDSTGYDLFVNETSANGNEMNKVFTLYSAANNKMFIKDDTLESLLDIAATPETSTEESISALYDYIDEQCYAVGLYQRCKLDTYQDWITGIVHNNSLNIAINCCTFNFGE